MPMKMIQRLAAALTVTLVATGTALAAPQTYVVDSKHTFPRFSYSHFGYSTQLSSFTHTRGTVVFNAQAKSGAVDIEIDMTSVNTGSSEFNQHIQGPDFFDTAQFPTASFKSTQIIFAGDQPNAIEGTLTIKGISKPVTLTLTSFQAMSHPMLKRPAVGANAFTLIKRSEFNAGKYAPYVGDEVRIDIALEAVAP